MRLLVCGSRDYNNYPAMREALDDLCEYEIGMPHTIIHGAAPGADALASRYAYDNRFDVEAYGAKWAAYGPRAGALRNIEMLDKGQPDYCVAFVWRPLGESRGTHDMVKRAKKAGLRVWVFNEMGRLVVAYDHK